MAIVWYLGFEMDLDLLIIIDYNETTSNLVM